MLAAIVQARTGSSRLPGKVLLAAAGKTLLEHLFERLRRSSYLEQIILATTTEVRDDMLVHIANRAHVLCFRGSEDDVLDRYFQAAREFDVNPIVRITSDCPLIDPKVVDRVIEVYLAGRGDYVSTNHPATFPDGLDVEVFSFTALERAWREARQAHEREHVTPYIWDHPELFSLDNVENSVDLSNSERWTLDYPEDYEFIRSVYENLYPHKPEFDMYDVLQLLDSNPGIRQINGSRIGVNWYAKHWERLSTRHLLHTRHYHKPQNTAGETSGDVAHDHSGVVDGGTAE